MKKQDRFCGLRGEEYAHLKKAYPHYDVFQGCIGSHVAAYAKKGMRILELGTGTGSTLEPTMKALRRKKVSVVALDSSVTDLGIATQIVSDPRVTALPGDMFELLLDMADDSFDVVFTGWTLHNFKEDERAFLFSEIKRILKKGGLFVSGDRFAYDDKLQQTRSIQEQLDLYEEFLPPELCTGWSDHIIEDENWKFLESEQLAYFPNGKFVYRKRNEGVFVAVNQ